MKLSIRVEMEDGPRLGPGKIRLLECILETGSISAAGRAMGMSYRRAWLLVHDLNTTLPEAVVEAQTGGKQGGGATLTPFGERVVRRYRAFEDEVSRLAVSRLSSLLKG